MKRPIIIIAGVVMVVLLLGVWVYILFFNNPDANDDRFADFGFGDTTDPGAIIDNPPVTEPVVDVSEYERLRQLTTVPVVGYQEVQTSSTSVPVVYFIEKGTGHISSINLDSGDQKRVSGTTIPAASRGVITPNGKYTIIEAGFGAQNQTYLNTVNLEEESLTQSPIVDKVVDFHATINNTFLLALQDKNGVVVTEYDPETKISSDLFFVPFSMVRIDWGDTATSSHYVYPKANSRLEGYVYTNDGSDLVRVNAQGSGITAVGNESFVLSSAQTNDGFGTNIFSIEENEISDFFTEVLPEKCVSLHNNTSFICANDTKSYSGQTPDLWYRGEVSHTDNIILIEPGVMELVFLADLYKESGRELDIIEPMVNFDDSSFYFVNKSDDNLWILDLN